MTREEHRRLRAQIKFAICEPPWCQHERRYQVTVYQIGTHEWIRLFACVPCTAALRRCHARLGPGGQEGITRIREVRAGAAPKGAET